MRPRLGRRGGSQEQGCLPTWQSSIGMGSEYSRMLSEMTATRRLRPFRWTCTDLRLYCTIDRGRSADLAGQETQGLRQHGRPRKMVQSRPRCKHRALGHAAVSAAEARGWPQTQPMPSLKQCNAHCYQKQTLMEAHSAFRETTRKKPMVKADGVLEATNATGAATLAVAELSRLRRLRRGVSQECVARL